MYLLGMVNDTDMLNIFDMFLAKFVAILLILEIIYRWTSHILHYGRSCVRSTLRSNR